LADPLIPGFGNAEFRIPDPDLPVAPWLHLEQAVTFALFGLSFHRRLDSRETVDALVRVYGTRAGAAMHGMPDDDHEAWTRVAGPFERAFSKAAFERQLKLKGLRGDSQIHEDIPFTYFVEHRGFATGNNEIYPSPVDADPFTIAADHLMPAWHRVIVEREGFVSWLSDHCPDLMRFVRGHYATPDHGQEVKGDDLSRAHDGRSAIEVDGTTSRPSRSRGRPAGDAERRAKEIQALLTVARREFPPPSTRYRMMAKHLLRCPEVQSTRFRSESAVIQILRGDYPPMKASSIRSPYRK
jgi:hypothetical protein